MTDVNSALQWNSDYAAAYKLRATIQRRQGDYKAAIADFKQAAKFYLAEHKADIARDCIGSVKEIQEKLRRTRDNNSKRSQQESWTDQHYFHHILKLTRGGKTPIGAMQDINWVLPVRSEGWQSSLLSWAGSYEKWKRTGGRSQTIIRRSHSTSNEGIVYRNRSKGRLQLGDYPGAVMDCNEALSIEEEAVSFVARGNAHRMMKDYMRAIEDYDSALGEDASLGRLILSGA